MDEAQFDWMRQILAAPSPVGLEAAMTYGVIKPFFERIARSGWVVHQFKGNAGVVLDTHPGREDMLKVMLIGHADKIRMQVRSIGEDGKIWINSDSFLPSVLIGHEVQLFSRDPNDPTAWRVLDGGTVEALGAIHFADPDTIAGKKGITSNMLYLELQLWGEDRKAQVEALGIAPGDPIIFKRPIKRGFAPHSFYGAYLDNGLGCYVTAEVARLVAEATDALKHVRVMFAIASHEEIGRMGSRILAAELKPDVVLGLDVSHDYEAAPGIKDRRLTPVRMGKGFTMSCGAIASEALNAHLEQAAKDRGIPYQKNVVGRDTGTDAMAGFFANIDAASTSIGFPIRNMHTISETGHTGDVLAAIYGVYALIERLERLEVSADTLRQTHPRLDNAQPLHHTAR
jgi:endoglucanase